MSDSLFVMNITLMLEEIEKRKLNEPGRQELERQKRFKRTLFKFANTRCKFSRNVLFVKLRISYLEHKTNYWVRSKINFFVDPQKPLLATVKRRKLSWFGHVTLHDSLSKTILQATLEGG